MANPRFTEVREQPLMEESNNGNTNPQDSTVMDVSMEGFVDLLSDNPKHQRTIAIINNRRKEAAWISLHKYQTSESSILDQPDGVKPSVGYENLPSRLIYPALRKESISEREIIQFAQSYAEAVRSNHGALFLKHCQCEPSEMKTYIELLPSRLRPTLPKNDPVFLLLYPDFAEQRRAENRDISLSDLRKFRLTISQGALNKLSEERNIATLGQLEDADPNDLNTIFSFGDKALRQCFKALQAAGLIGEDSLWLNVELKRIRSISATRKENPPKRREEEIGGTGDHRDAPEEEADSEGDHESVGPAHP